jgi:excisionase family DNA binding protein
MTVDAAQIQAISAKLDELLKRSGPPKRFLTVRSAAVYSDLSDDSIRRMFESGLLTAYRPVRGRVLVDRLQLDQVILSSTARPRRGCGLSRQNE